MLACRARPALTACALPIADGARFAADGGGSMHSVVRFLLFAVPRLHVHRFGPFFGLLAAGWAGSHRNGAIVMIVQRGHGLYTVQIRGHGDKWWPISHGAEFYYSILCDLGVARSVLVTLPTEFAQILACESYDPYFQ